jgi:hypothetical protein
MDLDLRRRTACLAIGATTLLASGALAAQSSAASIALDARCYLHTDRADSKVTIVGAGFLPLTSVDIGGGVFGTAQTDAAGQFAVRVAAPTGSQSPGAKTFKVTASTESFDTGQTVTASATSHYSAAGVTLSAAVAGFGKRLTYSFGGFRPGKPIYGHYFVGKHETGRRRFGKASGPCGTLKAKATAYPVSTAHPDRWTVFFDDLKAFKRHALPTFAYVFHKI